MDEIETLYAALNPRLLRIVRSNVTAPDGVLEDACQVAWSWLLSRRAEVQPGHEIGWLSTTATRIALRQLRRTRSEVPLERAGADEDPGWSGRGGVAPGAHEVFEQRERLAEIRELPTRQAQMIWMRGLGYGYAEISELTGASERTVERQLYKASRRLGKAVGG